MRDYLWVSLNEYQRMTAEDRKRWNAAIDLTRGCDWAEYQKHILEEFEKDQAEYNEEMSIGGQPFKSR